MFGGSIYSPATVIGTNISSLRATNSSLSHAANCKLSRHATNSPIGCGNLKTHGIV